MLEEPAGVEALPWLGRLGLVEVSIKLDQHVDELASHRRTLQDFGKFREPDQPVRVPGGPVRILAVDYPIDSVMRLASLVEECGDLADPVGCLRRFYRGGPDFVRRLVASTTMTTTARTASKTAATTMWRSRLPSRQINKKASTTAIAARGSGRAGLASLVESALRPPARGSGCRGSSSHSGRGGGG
jgi:hypothetical protein